MTSENSPRRPTSKDVAALARVSQSTVSYVMSGKRSVSPATRARIEAAMAELNYHPNAGARTLRTARTNVIALAVRLDETSNAADTAPYIHHIIQAARARDLDVVLSTSEDGAPGLIRLAGRAICDGIILMDIRRNDERVYAATQLAVPTVLVGRPDLDTDLDSVDFDSRAAGVAIVGELEATGHRHIAVIGDDGPSAANYRYIIDFHQGMSEAASSAGIDLKVWESPTATWDGFARIAPEVIATATDRLALVCRNQRTTDWALRLLQRYQLRPGQDVSLISYCPDAAAISYPVPITNVSTPIKNICEAAVDLLAERIATPDRPQRGVLISPNTLQRRATTALFS